MPEQSKTTKRILAFSSRKKLVAVFSSQVHAAKMLGVKTPTVKAACDGKAISACRHYLRWWDPNIEIDTDADFGTLTLTEYDQLCGVKRKTYEDSQMNRRNWKYNMKMTPEKLKRLKRNNDRANNSNNQ